MVLLIFIDFTITVIRGNIGIIVSYFINFFEAFCLLQIRSELLHLPGELENCVVQIRYSIGVSC